MVGEAIATLKPTTATEGTPAQFEVSLSGEVTDEVTLSWTTAAGTATAGADYTETSGTLRFAPGEGPAPNIVVETVPDTYAESAETFTVTLGTASAVGTIADDDMLRATVSGVEAVVEGAVASFPVALTGGTSTAPVAVTYTISGSATPGDDYTVPSGMLTLAAGAASGTISIETLDDRVLDPNETLEVTLSGASTTAGSAEADTTTVQTTILDQGMVTVSVAATAGSTVNEGETASFTVTLTGAVASAVELGWTTGGTGDTAVAAADYTAVTDGTLTFLPAESLPAESLLAESQTQTLTVTTLQDKVDEADETFTVTLAAPATGLPAGVTLQTAGVTVTIADDDERGVTVTPEALNVDEGGSVTYRVVLDTEPTAAVTVTASVQDGTDLTLSPESLTFTAGTWDTPQTVTVTAAEDDDAVADDAVDITHAVSSSAAEYQSVTAAGVTVTIIEK